jgi:hypothetical protein
VSEPAITPVPDNDELELTVSLGSVDTVTYEMTRRICYLLGLRARREGDDLILWPPPKDEQYYSFYAPSKDRNENPLYVTRPWDDDKLKKLQESGTAIFPIGSLYCDEGTYETLQPDGTRGYLRSWQEACDMTSLLGIIQKHFHPDAPIEHKSFMGRGFQQQWYYGQYRKAVLEGDQSKHPRIRFTE